MRASISSEGSEGMLRPSAFDESLLDERARAASDLSFGSVEGAPLGLAFDPGFDSLAGERSSLDVDDESIGNERNFMSTTANYDRCVAIPKSPPPHGKAPPRSSRAWLWLRKLWAFAGPGWIVAVMFVDPGNMAANVSTGTSTLFSQGWVLLCATLLGLAVQVFAARVGVATGAQLAHICRYQFSRSLRISAWIANELAIVAADFQDVMGSAIALVILVGEDRLPLTWAVAITVVDVLLVMLLDRFGVRVIEGIMVAWMTVMAVCGFALAAVVGAAEGVPSDWVGQMLLGTVEPALQFNSSAGDGGGSSAAAVQALGTLGAVVMPQNIFMGTGLVQSRSINRLSQRHMDEAAGFFTLDVGGALFVSFAVNLFATASFALLKLARGKTPLANCPAQVTLRTGGQCLAGLAGTDAAKRLYAVGLLASGQASTMATTLSGQMIMDGFIFIRLPYWQRTALTRMIAIIPAMLVALVASSTKHAKVGKQSSLIEDAFGLGNLVQTLALPFAIVPLLKVASTKKLMGPYAEKVWWRWSAYVLALLLSAANFAVIYELLEPSKIDAWLWAVGGAFGVAYLAALLGIVRTVMQPPPRRRVLIDWPVRPKAGDGVAWWEREVSVAQGLRAAYE